MQTAVSTSKVIILVGAGLTGSIVLRNGRLSDLILQLQEVMRGVNEAETSPGRYDTALLAAQIRHLAQEIRELTLSKPVTIYNGASGDNGNFASYLLPAAALGAMGYCYMWWKGLSFSDVMFVTKQNMANAVANVSKQLEQVSAALSSTKRHLSQRLENLDGKMDEQKELTKLVMNEVIDVKSDLYQIGFDVDIIQKMVSGLEGKIELLESKQDITNSGLWYLCQFAGGGIKEGQNNKLLQDISTKLGPKNRMKVVEDTQLKGLQFIPAGARDTEKAQKNNMVQNDKNEKRHLITKTSLGYPVGISLASEEGLNSLG